MQNKMIGIVAPKGSGKTYQVAEMIRSGQWGKVVVFDMLRETAYLTCCDEIVTGNPKLLANLLRPDDNMRIAYRPTVFENEDGEIWTPEFPPILGLTYLKGKCTFVIDEAHLLCSPQRCPPMLMTVNLIGRHRELNIFYITQRFAGVSRGLTGNTDEFYFYNVIEPIDLDAIGKRCGADVADRVMNLRRLQNEPGQPLVPGEILHWTAAKGVIENAAS